MCSYLGLFWSDNLLKMAQNVYQIIERSLLCKSNKILIKFNNNLQIRKIYCKKNTLPYFPKDSPSSSLELCEL